jgi:hypothetical protein
MIPTAYIIYTKYFSKNLFSHSKEQKPIRILDYSQEKALQRFHKMYPHALVCAVEHGVCQLPSHQQK